MLFPQLPFHVVPFNCEPQQTFYPLSDFCQGILRIIATGEEIKTGMLEEVVLPEQSIRHEELGIQTVK